MRIFKVRWWIPVSLFAFGRGVLRSPWSSPALRGFDASKTEQTYQIDPAEKTKPMFRVKIYNR